MASGGNKTSEGFNFLIWKMGIILHTLFVEVEEVGRVEAFSGYTDSHDRVVGSHAEDLELPAWC